MVVVILRSRRSWAAVVMGAIAVVAMIGSGSRCDDLHRCRHRDPGGADHSLSEPPAARHRCDPARRRARCRVRDIQLVADVVHDGAIHRLADRARGDLGQAIRRVSEAPLAGHGAFAELSLWTESYLRNDVGFEAFHSHNLVLTMLVTTGAVGCSLIVGAVAVTIARAVRTSRSRVVERRVETWRVDSLALLVILVGTGMTEASLDGPSPCSRRWDVHWRLRIETAH
ncbi:MAG: hypothetical protein R2710_22715 [Acidimicrobiales bacterium]